MAQAASELGMSKRWLQGFIKRFPDPIYLQGGRKKLFDERAMAILREAMREEARKCLSNSSNRQPAQRITGRAGRISREQNSPATWIKAWEQATGKPLKSSSPRSNEKSNVVPLPNRTSQ
jgi:hypothetical protein